MPIRRLPHPGSFNQFRANLVACLVGLAMLPLATAWGGTPDPFARDNLVAWCIVPFDSRKRGPEERAEMLRRMGITRLAYDWRAENIPTFDEELETLERWGISLDAFWFPAGLNEEARIILDLLKRHDTRTQLWVSMHGGEISASTEEQERRVREHADAIRPIAEAAAVVGCTVGLYNHGGWFGEPENQIEILKRLDLPNVGLVYNQHHGHSHVDRFPALLEQMKPYLLCLNLNGMTRDGDQVGKKILPLGTGDLDPDLFELVAKSGYTGPIGILGHTDGDAETTLLDNLDGLDWLVARRAGQEAVPESYSPPLSISRTLTLENAARRAELPEYQELPAARDSELTPAIVNPGLAPPIWTRSHGDNKNQRFSPLTQINRETVNRLEVAWTYHSNDGKGNIQSNPIIVNGVLYGPTVGNHMVAVDAERGEELWRFKTEGRTAFRGLVYWPGDGTHPERILFNAENVLWALDPKTGQPISEFGDGGKVMTDHVRVPGAVFKNVLVLPGYTKDVFGYDVATGNLLWTFHTIPQDGEFGRDTWKEPELGANTWGGMALDEDRGIAVITTGSPKPDFIGVRHHGQNLFSNCVIALDALTGKRLWHFQEIRHDIWDLDIPAAPNLVSVTHEGKYVDAVAQVTKLGNTLLLDRLSGKPLFPFRLKRAPVSRLSGERTWPYQPDLQLPEPFSRQVFTEEDITDLSDEAYESVAAQLKSANKGWFEPFEENKPTVLYGIHGGAEWTGAAFDPTTGHLFVSSNEIPWIITVFRPEEVTRDPNAPPTPGQVVYEAQCAKCHGNNRAGIGMAPPLQGLARRMNDQQVVDLLNTGRNSMPAAPSMTDEERKALLDYLFLRDIDPTALSSAPQDPLKYSSNGYPKLLDPEGFPGSPTPWGTLNCINLNTGRINWKVPLGTYPDLAAAGITDTGSENFGGATVTAGGLVFCAGTPDERIRAFDKDTGEILWEHELPWGGYAPPAVYEVNGREYLVIAATGGGKLGGEMGDAYVAFTLGD